MKLLSKHWGKLTIAATTAGIVFYVSTREEEKVLVSVVPIHYFPPNHRIDEFYVNSHYYSHSSFEGTPIEGACCVWIPERWRPGLEVDVSWGVGDWSQTNVYDRETFDPKKVRTVGIYRAKVPVEQYKEAGDLYVHFFEGGKVRVVPGVSDLSQFRSKPSIEAAAEIATQGARVSKPFTAEDMAKIDKEIEADRKRYGYWR